MSAPPAELKVGQRRLLWVAVATQTLGIGVIFALLAELQDRYGFATWGLGVIVGSSFLAAFAGHLTFSRLADRGMARRMVLTGAALSTVSLVWMGFASELWQFVGARVLLGLGEGAFVPASRRLALMGRMDRAGAELGKLMSAAVSGFMIGPAVGALLADTLGLRWAFWVPAIAAGVILVALVRTPNAPPTARVNVREMFALLGRPALLAGVILGVSEFMAFGMFEAIWARYLTDMGASTTFIGVSFGILVFPMVLLTPLGGRIADRRNAMRLALAALAFEVVIFIGFAALESVAAATVIALLYSVTAAFLIPATQAIVAQAAGPDLIATSQGLLEASGLVVAGIAAIAAAPIFSVGGPEALFGVIAVLMALLGLAAAVVNGRVARPLG